MSTKEKSKAQGQENSEIAASITANSPETPALEPSIAPENPENFPLQQAFIAHLAGVFSVSPAAIPAVVVDGKIHYFTLADPQRHAWYLLYPYGFAAGWYGIGNEVYRWPFYDAGTPEERKELDDRAADVMTQWKPAQPTPAPRKRKGA